MRSRASWIVLLLLAAAFAAGLLRLFQLRFERGDIYPPYSSMRADPMGCRVLYESLAELPGLDVARHHDELDQFDPHPPPALLLAGTDTYGWAIRWGENADVIRTVLAAGSRVVVAIRPRGASFFTNDVERLEYETDTGEEEQHGDPEGTGAGGPETNRPDARGNTNFVTCTGGSCARFSSWGFEVSVDWSNRLDRLDPVAVRTADAPKWLPPDIPCITHASFTNLSTAWTVVYEREGRPVVIERELNGGSIVILADAYVLSNEAMLGDRRPGLMSWLVGDHRRIVFDESHHGIAWSNSLGDLARKYGLAGFLLGLLLLAGLYVWMSASPLLPREAEEIVLDSRVSGRDSAAGLINLLRRNIPEKALLDECVTAWESARPGPVSDARRAEVRRLLAGASDPAAAYRAITRALGPAGSGREKKEPR